METSCLIRDGEFIERMLESAQQDVTRKETSSEFMFSVITLITYTLTSFSATKSLSLVNNPTI